MSRPESTTAQVVASGSKLSADAQSFVPSSFMTGSTASNGASGSGQNLSAQQLSQLPSYMTTCYPFVQQTGDYHGPLQQNNSPRPPAPWQGSGRVSPGNFPGPRAPNLLQTGYIMTGNRAAGPHTVRPRHQGFVARQQYPNPGLATAPSQPFLGASGGPGIAQQPGTYPNGPRPFPVFTPLPGRTNSTTNSWPANLPSDYPFPQGYYPPGSQVPAAESSESAERGTGKERKSSKKKKEVAHNNNMVSVGIQNESGILNGLNNHSSKKKAKTKTIIVVDVVLQTDFSEEIANLTLAEKPNSLYKTRGWQDRYQHDTTTTDSEEVDSDSGYSSPMHRRNQATVVTYIPTNSQPVLHTKPPGYSSFAAGASPAGPVSTMSASPLPYPTYAMAAHSTTSYMPYVPNSPAGGATTSTESQSTTNPTAPSVGGQASCGAVKTDPEDAGDATSGRRRRKRSRRRRRKTDGPDVGALSDEPSDLHRAHSSSNVSRASNDAADSGLKFEDEEEFPDLTSSVSGASAMGQQSSVGLSYSDILKSQPSANPVASSATAVDGCGYSSSSSSKERKQAPGTPKLSKNARKRQKRREAANRAAEEELAEITIEQQVLKELSAKQIKQNQTSSKKSKQPIALNFADMIDALERQQQDQRPGEKAAASVSVAGGAAAKEVKKDLKAAPAANPLDASAPLKRGKERETPKPKKPSPLKKVILKEREERKRQRLFEEQIISPVSSAGSQLLPSSTAVTDSDFSQDGVSSKTSSIDQGTCSTPMSAEMSPISQTSPISMSPLSPGGSPLSSGVTSPIANAVVGERKSNVVMKIHSRRFREYCTQVLDKDIDGCCTQLLQDLVRFQDRLFHKDPTKAKSKRRIVLGLREVTKHLKLKKIKCVIISPNLERIQSKGGLDDALNNILDLCSEQYVPFVFALGRRALGRACAKLVPVSVAGIFNYEGTEDTFKRLMDLTEKARSAYDDMVMSLEKEISENLQRAPTTTSAFPQIFSHLGHSRTPSACSAISFTSSILSEPISENYPYSEPETDSRGYEIIRDSLRDEAGETLSRLMCEDDQPDLNEDDEYNEEEEEEEEEEEDEEDEEEEEEEEEEQAEDSADSPNSSTNSNDKVIKIVENLHEIDEGNEADTEDYIDFQNTKQVESSTSEEAKADNEENSECDADENADDNDTIRDLPHISSIHSSQVDLTAEILSQHSSKTPDLSAEVQSTHSSRTPVESGTPTPQDITSAEGHAQNFEVSTASGQKLKNSNKERIESWVAETQHQMGKLTLQNGVDHHSSTTDNAPQQNESSKCLCNEEISSSKEEVNGTGCGRVSNQISCGAWNTCDQLYNHTNNNFCQEQEQQT